MTSTLTNRGFEKLGHETEMVLTNRDFEKIQKNEMLILEKHANEEYKEALDLLEDS